MAGLKSTATTQAPERARGRLRLPVPDPRSTTLRPGRASDLARTAWTTAAKPAAAGRAHGPTSVAVQPRGGWECPVSSPPRPMRRVGAQAGPDQPSRLILPGGPYDNVTTT